MSLFSSIAFAVSGIFPLLYLAGAILFFIKFRGTPAGLVGGMGFLAWFALLAVRTVMLMLGVDIQPFLHGFHFAFLAAFAVVLYGLATMPVGGAAAPRTSPATVTERPARPRSVTVISVLLIVLSVIGLAVVVVTGYLTEFDERFLPLMFVLLGAALLQAVLGVAMLHGHNWARWTFLVLSPLSLLAALVTGSLAAGSIVQLIFWGVSAYFLTRPTAAAYFGSHAGRTAQPHPAESTARADERRNEPPREPGRSAAMPSREQRDEPFETAPRLDAFRWMSGQENPASGNVESRPAEGLVRFDCPTCGSPVYCKNEQIHGLVGAMVACGGCGNISHVPATCLDPGQAAREPVRACVFVPIREYSDWYYAHPQCRGADPTHEAMYGLWTYCANCKHEYVPSVLSAFAMSGNAGGMAFNASSASSARDFEALERGGCPECGDANLLALRLEIPHRVRLEIEDHLRRS